MGVAIYKPGEHPLTSAAPNLPAGVVARAIVHGSECRNMPVNDLDKGILNHRKRGHFGTAKRGGSKGLWAADDAGEFGKANAHDTKVRFAYF
jgi:hypothetical protein